MNFNLLIAALDLANLFAKGGFFMWPLLLCSILGLAVILDRCFFFLRIFASGDPTEKLRTMLESGGTTQACGEVCAKSIHPSAAVMRTYLSNLKRPPGLRTELVKAEGAQQMERVERRLRVLATVSHVAPLLGLLGTVTGLVIAFAQIQALGGSAKPSDLAGGIWEALLTTVFGLIIAIPCMAAYHWLEGLADRTMRRMQRSIVMLEDVLEISPEDGGADALSPATDSPAEEEFHAVH